MSSSPKKSRKTDPQTQARLPLTTMMVDELTDKNIPVPPPHSIECLTVSQAAEKGKNIVKLKVNMTKKDLSSRVIWLL